MIIKLGMLNCYLCIDATKCKICDTFYTLLSEYSGDVNDMLTALNHVQFQYHFGILMRIRMNLYA